MKMFNFEPFIEKTACISSAGRQITYGDLGALAQRIAECLEPHQLVFVMCSNTIGSVAGYVAFVNNEDVVLLLDARMAKTSLESLMEVYQPKYIWEPKREVDDDVDDDVDKMEKVVEAEGYVLWKRRDEGPAVADELAVLLATSGSTGSPKLVRLSKENLRANASSIIEYLHITDKERPILGLPMNYAYGLSIVNSHLLSGATLLLTEAVFAEFEFWKFARENGVTSYSGVPYAYETIKKLGIWKMEMTSLRTLTQAGGMMSKELISFYDQTFRPRGVKFYAMYGQTEATARIAYLEPDKIKEKAGSIGKAIPGGRLLLKNASGNEIKGPFTVGELVYEGANVSLGYADGASDLMKGDENRGVVYTGDMAYRDEDGYYFITGRKGRFVKLYGIRISLDHVESMLRSFLPDCACVGDDTLLTVFTTNAGAEEEKIIKYLVERTNIIRKAFRIRTIEKIPRNSAGKILYQELEHLSLQTK